MSAAPSLVAVIASSSTGISLRFDKWELVELLRNGYLQAVSCMIFSRDQIGVLNWAGLS